jgi:hypothetical protein
VEEPRKIGRPKKVIVDYEAEREKQREYMRNYMKAYNQRMKDDPVYAEKRKVNAKKYIENCLSTDEAFKVKNAEYAKMYYRRMKDAYDLSKLPPVN